MSGEQQDLIPAGHPLHVAVSDLQEFYGGPLPHPAIGYWRKLLRLAHNESADAEDEAEQFLNWVKAEIESKNREMVASDNSIVVATLSDSGQVPILMGQDEFLSFLGLTTEPKPLQVTAI